MEERIVKKVRLPKVGDEVNVIEKRNYESGELSSGKVRRVLSNPHEVHPRGNKVELENGVVGRMVSFVDEAGLQKRIDPQLREEITAERRAERSPRNPDQRDRRPREEAGQGRPREKFDRPSLVSLNPSPPDYSNLPGEDDLR